MDPIFPMPVIVPEQLSLILLIISAVFVEKHYISRLAIVSNVFFLFQLLLPHWYEIPETLQIYLNVGVLFAFVALVSRVSETSLPSSFYRISRLLYGSLTIIAIFLYLSVVLF